MDGIIVRFQLYLHSENAGEWPGRLLRGSGWSFAGTFGTYAIKLLSFILVARMLGGEGFGKLGMIQVTVSMLNVFAGYGLGVTATKYIAELLATDPGRVGRIIGLTRVVTIAVAGISSLLVFAIAPWLARDILAAPELTFCLRISIIALFFGALNGAQVGVLSGFEAFKSIAQSNFVAAIAGAIAMITGTYYAGLAGSVMGYGAGFAIQWAVFYVVINRTARAVGVRPVYATCFREIKLLWRMGIPATLAGLLVTPVIWACNAMLVRQVNGYAEMGILNAANQWRTALLFLPSLIGGVTIPLIAQRVGNADYKSANRIVRRLFQIFLLASIPLMGVIFLLSPWIMGAYRPEYTNCWPVLVLIVLAATLQTCEGPVLKYLEGTGRMWSIFIMNIGYCSVLLAGTFLLLKYGALGLALASVCAFLVHGLCLGIYSLTVMRRDIDKQIPSSAHVD